MSVGRSLVSRQCNTRRRHAQCTEGLLRGCDNDVGK